MVHSLIRALPTAALALLVACGSGAPSGAPAGGRAAPSPPTGAAASAPAPAATAPTAPAAPEPATLRLGLVTTTAMFWPLWSGLAKGFFEAEGITVEQIVFRVSSDATRAVYSDSIDMAAGTAFDSVVLATEQGADVVAVAGALNKPTYSLIVRPEIRSFADLRGKTLGVSDLKDGSTILLQRLLERQGLRPGDYDMIQTGGTPDRYAAVKSGGTVGAMLTQPNDFQAQDEGFPSLGLVSDIIPDYQFTVYAVRKSWAQRNQDPLVRWLRAYVKGCQWLYDPANKEEAIRILVENTRTTEDYARRTYELLIEKAEGLPRAGELNTAGVRTVLDIMAEMGNLPRPIPPVEKYVDTSYLERARANTR
jgi:ABC-type nitrate/sulfonate/bicarbonate transport system substrate-binding protein